MLILRKNLDRRTSNNTEILLTEVNFTLFVRVLSGGTSLSFSFLQGMRVPAVQNNFAIFSRQ